MFRLAYHCEDWLGVAHDENHIVMRWLEAPIFFSFAQKGDAISAHFSAKRESLRSLRKSIDEYCQWAFYAMTWCKMIIACVERKSVARLIAGCGFQYLTDRKGLKIFVRYR